MHIHACTCMGYCTFSLAIFKKNDAFPLMHMQTKAVIHTCAGVIFKNRLVTVVLKDMRIYVSKMVSAMVPFAMFFCHVRLPYPHSFVYLYQL